MGPADSASNLSFMLFLCTLDALTDDCFFLCQILWFSSVIVSFAHSLGDLNLELHCDMVPRACENFFVLAEGGYYTDTIFHRSIPRFMIQARLLFPPNPPHCARFIALVVLLLD